MKIITFSTMNKEKFLCYAGTVSQMVHGQMQDVLKVFKMEKISKMLGWYDKRGLKDLLDREVEKGTTVVVEETTGFLSENGTQILLNDSTISPGRVNRDWAFDQFQELYHSGDLFLPKELEVIVPKSSSFELKDDERGKPVYVFRNALKPQFRLILLLVAVFCSRPLDEMWLNEYDPHFDVLDNDPLRTFHRITTQLDHENYLASLEDD